MRKPFTKLYLHLVWSRWNRAPLITPPLLQAIDRCIRAECVELGVDVIAFGGVSDHVHLLVRFPTTITIAELVKQVKGSSSHLVSQRLHTPSKWQGRFGAFAVSPRHVPMITGYVLDQAQHHADNTTRPILELTEEEVHPEQEASSVPPS